jgi:hypothetical protein
MIQKSDKTQDRVEIKHILHENWLNDALLSEKTTVELLEENGGFSAIFYHPKIGVKNSPLFSIKCPFKKGHKYNDGKIVDIGVERLNDISEQDAVSQGLDWEETPFLMYGKRYRCYPSDCFGEAWATKSYESLWKNINGKDSWAKNPFVWVVYLDKVSSEYDSLFA